ncbi:MAG: succinylglutamate desuccinylase/aspartoacylase family protein [Gemmatimonadota bacterium]|nr:succinylglutamate desuccinylase/aspartoacylase family protein [Gemmatimonadota bacterium]MDH3423496.1 succinylglutamate desuccinylase/aspartoacylase family protein [Gemmatimonadota bacterium]
MKRTRQGGAPVEMMGREVDPGARLQLDVPVGRLPSGDYLSIPIEIVNGSGSGPTIWLSGAIHGDEIVGVEIIRRLLDLVEPAELSGTIIAAPVVNIFGFVFESRYLPDRRDLNRSFPGSKRGSLAARLARLFMDEVVSRCEVGIDFHAGSDGRANLPQLRGNMDDKETRRLAKAFAAPVMIHARPIKGSLRAAALRRGKRVLLFEGGEPSRFNPTVVEAGVDGTLRALKAMGMIDAAPAAPKARPLLSRSTKWVRAPRGGIVRLATTLGDRIEKGASVGVIADPTDRDEVEVLSRASGIVVGQTVNPLVSMGDALVHVAEVDSA